MTKSLPALTISTSDENLDGKSDRKPYISRALLISEYFGNQSILICRRKPSTNHYPLKLCNKTLLQIIPIEVEIQITLDVGERIEIQKSQADALSTSCSEYNTDMPKERTKSNQVLTMTWRWSWKKRILTQITCPCCYGFLHMTTCIKQFQEPSIH